MLELSIIDSGQRKLAVENGNLYILLKQIVSAFQYKASEKAIVISSKIGMLESAWFDRDIIEKITSNLLSNAIKYAPANSMVILTADAQEEMLVLSVVNQTANVGKCDLGKLFQRFYQDNKLSEGIGIGLALVRELVDFSKGTIIANNLEGNKIQFTATLPINREAFEESDLVPKAPRYIETPHSTILKEENYSGEPTVLIVEDEPEIRNFIATIFKDNYKILEATNGQSGIEIALRKIPDIIISDVMMPKMNGFQLCDFLKTNEMTSHIPIILLTAKVGEENEIEGLKTGADAYITKPFNGGKLQIWVEKLIETRRKLQRHFSKTLNINPDIPIPSTESDFLKKLKEVVENHVTDPDFTSDRFGKLMHMSRTQLHRKLKAIVGMSASEFIRSQRLKLAVQLLAESDVSIAEIGYRVGFNSPSYFSKCFRDAYNCTPNEYLSNRA